MTLTDCPYCHNTSATEISKDPKTVRCNICGIYRQYPRINKDGQILLIKKFNDKIDVAHHVNLLESSGTTAEIQQLIKIFPDLKPSSRILDVGSAEGSFIAALQRNGFTATGLEPLERLVQLGRKHGLDIYVGRFEHDGIPPALAGRVFDLVCFRESIYYMADLRETFTLLRKMLRRGGGLYIKTHVATSIFYLKNKNYLARYGPTVSGMPTLKALRGILKREGHVIQKAGYFRFNVLHTLGWPYAQSFPGKLAGTALSPIVRTLGKADRLFIFANRL